MSGVNQTLITRVPRSSSWSAPSLRKSSPVKLYLPATCVTPSTSRMSWAATGASAQPASAAPAARMRINDRRPAISAQPAAPPGRPDVVGVLEGAGAGRSLMLCGHLDAVGVEGMERPFAPVEVDGCLHGRGAQDMKGGIAAMTGAARLLADQGGLAAGRLIVAAVADEELASAGAEALVGAWRADAAVV